MRTRFSHAASIFALGALLAHCGSGQEGAPPKTAAGPAPSSSIAPGAPNPDESPFVPRTNDPICGANYRWAGSRCVQGEEAPTATERKAATLSREKKSGDGLVVEDLTVGAGREVRMGDTVKVHYTGTLADGTVFDSSRSNGTPFEFRVGSGQVIKGFDRGVLGMKIGGRRKVTIPYQLGYGTEGSPPRIPPRATLIFDLELLDVM